MSTEQQPVPSDQNEGQRSRVQGPTSLPGTLTRLRAELPMLTPRRSIGSKLILVLGVAMVITFGALGWMNMHQSRKTVEDTTFRHAARVSDVVVRSASNYMMRNDRLALYEMMGTIADEPGVVRLRIINTEGKISFSTDPEEIGRTVNKGAELCSGCHTDPQSLSLAHAHERFRIYSKNNERVLAVVTPINNEPACSNASCHAHPEGQKVLGVLDTHMSLEEVDLSTASNDRRMLLYTAMAAITIGLLSWVFIYRMVHMPLRRLQFGTERLAKGDLGYQIEEEGFDEPGELAHSFNIMSRQLSEARDEITAWTHTLEGRVEQKTRELKRAHDQMMTVEKTLTIGEMAAVVAHEINNPLAGILTYAKLVKKWLLRGIDEQQTKEAGECLDLIASESKRCGDLVNNLLTFSRRSPIHMESTDLNTVILRAVKLIQHRTDMQGVQVQVSTDPQLSPVYCDGSQIEQVILALVMNAIDAMPHGGNLWISSRLMEASEVELIVRDDGMGIPPELLPKIFEPFTTTKEVGKGVGLGCAISKGIVERHGGRIELQSDLGVGTTFRVYLPLDARVSETAQTALAGITP
jgi:two-component system, NtrC family, sensor kinase